jgi:hypothetical protein
MSNNTAGNNVGFLWLGGSLALGLIVSAFILSGTLEKIKSNQSISVKGYAEKNIKADLGVWTGTVTIYSFDLVSGYTKLQNDVEAVLQYLQGKGIGKDIVKLGAITNFKNYKYNADGQSTGEFAGYTLERQITVSTKDVGLVEAIASESTSLIQKGVEINSAPPQYFYTKLNDLKVEMLSMATKDAKVRAETIAKSSGSEVGTVKSASQGVFQITSLNSTDVSDYGEYNLSSIDKTIKAVVTIDFSVK